MYSARSVFGLLLIITCLSENSIAQKEVPINLVLKNVTVRDFKAPFKAMPVLVEKDAYRYPAFEITDQTVFKKDRKNTLPVTSLKPGMRVVVTIDYLQISNRAIAKEIALDPGYYGTTTVEGIYEDLSGDRAFVDGQTIVMGKDKKLRGLEGWKGKEFTQFSDMQLGASLKMRGKRDLDGVITAESGTVSPVLMAEDDRMLRKGMELAMKVSVKEIKIGNKRSLPLIANLALQDYVNTVGMKLVPKYVQDLPLEHPDKIDFKFYIVQDETVNAAALPDGTVLIHTGLLQALENEAQLSAVLGHELAHVIYKHHTAKMRNSSDWKGVPMAAGIAAGAAYGAEAGVAVGLMADAISKMSMNNFSRKKENQADRIGLYYMVNAGYDPREAAAFWQGRMLDLKEKEEQIQLKNAGQNMALSLTGGGPLAEDDDDKEDEEPATVPSYDPTHPKFKERFINLNFLLATTYAYTDYSKLKQGAPEYKVFLAKLNAKKTKEEEKVAPAKTKSAKDKAGSGKPGPKKPAAKPNSKPNPAGPNPAKSGI